MWLNISLYGEEIMIFVLFFTYERGLVCGSKFVSSLSVYVFKCVNHVVRNLSTFLIVSLFTYLCSCIGFSSIVTDINLNFTIIAIAVPFYSLFGTQLEYLRKKHPLQILQV